MANNNNRETTGTPITQPLAVPVPTPQTFTDHMVTIAAARLTKQSWPHNDKAEESFVRETKRIVQLLRQATDD